MKIYFPESLFRPVFAAAMVGAFGGAAQAQTPPDNPPLILKVRPSGSDKIDDARARQEKLLRRLEQSDYWVRSICQNCGDAWKHQVYGPFNPLEALAPGGKANTSAE